MANCSLLPEAESFGNLCHGKMPAKNSAVSSRNISRSLQLSNLAASIVPCQTVPSKTATSALLKDRPSAIAIREASIRRYRWPSQARSYSTQRRLPTGTCCAISRQRATQAGWRSSMTPFRSTCVKCRVEVPLPTVQVCTPCSVLQAEIPILCSVCFEMEHGHHTTAKQSI